MNLILTIGSPVTMFKNSAENVLIPYMMPEALHFRSCFHDCFSREPVKVRKDATTGGIVCRDGSPN